MVLARFCKNVIKTSSRSNTGANYQKCVSCGTFIDFQYVWKELLFFLLDRFSYIWSPVIQQKKIKSPLHMTSVVHVTQVNMNVNIPTPPQPSDVTSVVHVTQVNMNVNIPTPPHPSDVTSVVHVTQVNMNVNIPTPPQPSDVTSVVHVTQVNMNVNIPTLPQPSDVTSVAHASISRATCIQSAKMTKTLGSLMAP